MPPLPPDGGAVPDPGTPRVKSLAELGPFVYRFVPALRQLRHLGAVMRDGHKSLSQASVELRRRKREGGLPADIWTAKSTYSKYLRQDLAPLLVRVFGEEVPLFAASVEGGPFLGLTPAGWALWEMAGPVVAEAGEPPARSRRGNRRF